MDQGVIRLYVEYYIKEDKIVIQTSGVKDQVGNMLSAFLKTQRGMGNERVAPPKMDVYKIRLDYNAIEGFFNCFMNFNHRNLREGILLRALTWKVQDQIILKTWDDFAEEDMK